MRIGMFIVETGSSRTPIDELLKNARWADQAGLATGWLPHIPWSLDALSAATLAGPATERLEIGTAVVPTYPRHPLALAQQALSAQAACTGRLTLGVGPSHPVVIENMFGLEYARPARHVRAYLEVLDAAFAGTGQVDVENEEYRVHAMLDVPGASTVPVLVAALAPLMLQLAGERTDGTILWMADERAVGEHVVPRLVAAAHAAGRPDPRVVASLPVAVCDDGDAARERAAQLFALYGEIPTYRRILDRGGATGPADVCVVGDEAAVEARLRGFRDAGVTDLAATVFPVGEDHAASRQRTRDLLAHLAPTL
jgi:F420-dependent oxidoreductase-like protein